MGSWRERARLLTFDGVRSAPERGIPWVGADTRSVLRDIEIGDAKIADLFRSNVIADAPIAAARPGQEAAARRRSELDSAPIAEAWILHQHCRLLGVLLLSRYLSSGPGKRKLHDSR